MIKISITHNDYLVVPAKLSNNEIDMYVCNKNIGTYKEIVELKPVPKYIIEEIERHDMGHDHKGTIRVLIGINHWDEWHLVVILTHHEGGCIYDLTALTNFIVAIEHEYPVHGHVELLDTIWEKCVIDFSETPENHYIRILEEKLRDNKIPIENPSDDE